MITDASNESLGTALSQVNARYSNNIVFDRLYIKGRRIHFTLTVKSRLKPGAKVSVDGRHLKATKWEVSRYFLECLFKTEPNAVALTRLGRVTTIFNQKTLTPKAKMSAHTQED